MKDYLKIIIVLLLVVIVGFAAYYFMKNKKISTNLSTIKYEPKTPTQLDADKEYKNNSYNLTLKYPSNWQSSDLGGQKNVTEPLTAENIIYLYDPILPNNDKNLGASVKVFRFVKEENNNIKSADDWLNYIKEKVDNFIADKEFTDKINYKLISLQKIDEVNGHWVVREDYTRESNIRGRDFYIYIGNDFYQLISKCEQKSYDKYSTIFDKIEQSFSVAK